MNWYIGALKKYADFGGRARRQEFWMFYLINCAVALVLELPWFFAMSASGPTTNSAWAVPYYVYMLAVFIPMIAVTVRRLHDTNRSGGWYFIGLVPLIGFIVLIVFLATDGQHGENRYGPDPKAGQVQYSNVAAGWLQDPTGRHELRYWDSRVWTGQVADAGVVTTDPL